MAKGRDGVNIPVSVTGSDEAQAKLKQVGQTAQAVGGATGEAAQGQEKLNKKVGEGGDLLGDFSNKGEKVVKQFLGAFSPQLANAADMLFDMNEGVMRITPAMLAMGAAGAALGGLAIAYEAIAKSAREAEEAILRVIEAEKKRRGVAIDERSKVSQELAGMGVNPAQADAVLATAAKLNDPNAKLTVPRELAINTGVAEQLAKKFGIPFEAQEFLAGAAVSGGKAVDFGDTEKTQKAALESVLKAGQAPNAAAIRDSLLFQQNEASKRDTLPADVAVPIGSGDRISTLLERAKATGKWSDREIKDAELFLSDPRASERMEVFKASKNMSWMPQNRSSQLAEEIWDNTLMRGRPINPGPQGFPVNDPTPASERSKSPPRSDDGRPNWSPDRDLEQPQVISMTTINIGTNIGAMPRSNSRPDQEMGSAAAFA